MDLALRVLLHRFQIVFDRIRLTNKCNQTAASTDNIPRPRRSCSGTYKINKLLVSPNERLSNIVLEGTIEYNTYPASQFHGKESNATSEIESTWKERPKCTWPAYMLTCSPNVLSHVSVTSFTGRDMPLQKLSGVAILVSLQECSRT